MKVSQILIVDDKPGDVALLAEFLKNNGYGITLAGDGFKALAACKVRVPDMILLDLQMPLMSGVDVYKKLQADEKAKHIPVIFLRNPEDLGFESLPELKERPILIKPLEPQDVLSVIKTVVKEKSLREELRTKDGQVQELALTDSVTSCRNLRYLTEFLKAELSQSSRYTSDFVILAIELDNHKELQTTYGEKALEPLLAQLAVILARGNRKADVLARTDSFEFVLALPFTQAQGAIEVAERIRTSVFESSFNFAQQMSSATVSIGICQFRPDMGTNGEMLLSYARAALAQAREAGGNLTFMAE